MFKLFYLGMFLIVSCTHTANNSDLKNRNGMLLNPEYYQSNTIPETGTPEPKQIPIVYNRYDDTIKPGVKAKYNIYANACILSVTYRDLAEHKVMLKDNNDHMKLKSFPFYFIAINNAMINETNPECSRMIKEDRIIYSFEVPAGKQKSFLEVFLSPSLEIRREN